MTDSVARKLSDLSLKQNESRAKFSSSSNAGNPLPDDKNSVNAWKTSQQKSAEKPVLENDNWPNLHSQSDNSKVELSASSRRGEEKHIKSKSPHVTKENPKWNHSDTMDPPKGGGRGRYSGSMNQSSSNSHPNTATNRPRRGSNYMGRNRIVSDRGKNNGYNRMSSGRGMHRYESEDHSKPSTISETHPQEIKEVSHSNQHGFDDAGDKKMTEKNFSEEVDHDSKRAKESKKPLQNYPEDQNPALTRGMNVISSPSILPGAFYIPSGHPQAYPQPIPAYTTAGAPMIPDIYYGQIPSGDQNPEQSYQTVKTPVIDAKNMLELCESAGWDKVFFPKSLRESEPFVDKIPLDQLKEQDRSDNQEEPSKGGANNVIIIDKKTFLVPKTRYNTTFLKFSSKLDYIRHHLNYYFSEQNLSKDTHLNSIINANRNTCPVSELLQFNRLKWVKTTEAELQEAAQNCYLIRMIVNPEGKTVVIPVSLNKQGPEVSMPDAMQIPMYPLNSTPGNNIPTNDANNYPSGDQYSLSTTPVSSVLTNANNRNVNPNNTNTSENSNPPYDTNTSNQQTIQNNQQQPNSTGPMMLSFHQANFLNQSPAFIQQQQPHGQVHGQPGNPGMGATVSAPNFFPIQALPNYFPIYQQNAAAHAAVAAHNAAAAAAVAAQQQNQQNNANSQSSNNAHGNNQPPTSNHANAPAMIVNNGQGGGGTPNPGAGGAYLPVSNSVSNQPPIQVLTAFSQQSPFFNNQTLNANPQVAMANAHLRIAQLTAAGAFHPQTTPNQQQPFNQNMLFHIIPPPNNMSTHHLSNVFQPQQQQQQPHHHPHSSSHQESVVHGIVNRGQMMANPSLMASMGGGGHPMPVYYSSMSPAVSMAEQNPRQSAPYNNSANTQKSPATASNMNNTSSSETFNNDPTPTNDSFSNE